MALNAGAVLYNLAQTLSTAQQQQAVNNIGALSVNSQTLTQEQKQQVTTNIGAIPAASKGTAGGVATLNDNLKVMRGTSCQFSKFIQIRLLQNMFFYKYQE